MEMITAKEGAANPARFQGIGDPRVHERASTDEEEVRGVPPKVIVGKLRGRATFAILAALILIAGCERPTRNQTTLKAIKAESELLMKTHPIKPPKAWAEVPKGQWPPAIAKLEPQSVTVYEWGVDIWTNPHFDGGWGYHVPRRKEDLPRPAGAYSEPGPGVYWHGPL